VVESGRGILRHIDGDPYRTHRAGFERHRRPFVEHEDAAPGLYRTPVTVACDGDEQRLELAVEVTGRTLPAPSEWRYHLDLWQHPAAVARVEGTEMWSDAHFEALRPVMKPLADAGQKVVTATLNKDPWNNQCY